MLSLPVRLSRLLVAVVLACAGLVLLGAPAQACSCAGTSVRAEAQRSDVVFSGVLRDQQRTGRGYVYTVDVERIYQGRVTDSSVEVRSATGTSCDLGSLEVDRGYVVFASGRASSLTSGQCTGTQRSTPAYVADVEQVLGRGNAIPQPPGPEPEAPAPEFTRVADGETPPFLRTAAPGGAMVLVGLLGLVLFRKRA